MSKSQEGSLTSYVFFLVFWALSSNSVFVCCFVCVPRTWHSQRRQTVSQFFSTCFSFPAFPSAHVKPIVKPKGLRQPVGLRFWWTFKWFPGEDSLASCTTAASSSPCHFTRGFLFNLPNFDINRCRWGAKVVQLVIILKLNKLYTRFIS